MEIHWKAKAGQNSRFNLGFGKVITFVDGIADVDAELAQELLVTHSDQIGSGRPEGGSVLVPSVNPPPTIQTNTPAVTTSEGSEE